MQHMSPIKKIVLTAACSALCVVVPMAFHAIPNAGSILLPMHIPVLLCGMLCGWPYGLVCGIIGPMLSSLITMMPPTAILPSMMAECAVYGCAVGLMMRFVRTGKLYLDLYISLPGAMLAGRVIYGILNALIFAPGTTLASWATASFVTALPGILVQLLLLPTLVVALERSRLVPQRYAQRV